ncbi:MAG: competence protein ComEC [Solirubrobacterales bacterium]|nr:competence protein ComEC [Solirubrobacterales bacterium]
MPAAPRTPHRVAAIGWLVLVAAAGIAAGLGFGSLRVAAIDAGALDLAPGSTVTVNGFVAAVPRRVDGEVGVRVDTPGGRVLVEAPEPVADLDVGAGIEATGTIREPTDFERDYLARLGVRRILAARAIEPREPRRGGLLGLLDRVRDRAQEALSSGTPPASAALLRGFVLGQDDRIDAGTVDEFKRSGLAHLLAVSGQNVVLLAILAAALLSVAGAPIRARLLAILALIVVYVLVTGAGPSIQRAGVMGAAGVAAALAGRPRSRWYILLLAVAVTLGLNPRAAGDVGWQLSFAAVVGILLVCAPLARLLAGPDPRPPRRALAEAAALTISATLATAPLISLQFGVVSVVSLPANLAAVVAEAPVMWLGMLAAAAGQLPWLPVEPITWLAGLLAAYIAQVAAWFARPGWAQVEIGVAGAGALAATYALLGGGVVLTLRWSARRRGLSPVPARRARRRLALGLAACLAAAAALLPAPASESANPRPGLRVSVLDVGQGDAILLQPADGEPVLVDAGPAEAGVAAELDARGIDGLAALFVTHADADHSGGAPDVLGAIGARHLLFCRADPRTIGAARAAGVETTRVGSGFALRSGDLRMRVLWPPPRAVRERVATGPPNALSLVLLARWHRFRILLTGDAEAELAPVHPGDVDVLKLAHHGSADAGLPALLAEAAPELAVISVGEHNPYGHPAPATLAALERAGVPVARTDVDGEITISVGGGAWSADAAGPGG